MADLQIIREGNADFVLLQVLRVHPKWINEKGGGKQKVINTVKSSGEKFYHDIFVGLVDKDKDNHYPDFKLFKSQYNTTLYKKDHNQYLIELCCPAIEQWLLDSANEFNINPVDYELPSKSKELKAISGRQAIRNNKNFIRFIRELNTRNAPAFVYLNELLEELFQQAGITRY